MVGWLVFDTLFFIIGYRGFLSLKFDAFFGKIVVNLFMSCHFPFDDFIMLK